MNEPNGFRVYLVCAEWVLLNEVGNKQITQKSLAMTCRMAMEAERGNGEVIDWRKVNEAIIARWSAKGLERIKKMAWPGNCFDLPVKGGAPC